MGSVIIKGKTPSKSYNNDSWFCIKYNAFLKTY